MSLKNLQQICSLIIFWNIFVELATIIVTSQTYQTVDGTVIRIESEVLNQPQQYPQQK